MDRPGSGSAKDSTRLSATIGITRDQTCRDRRLNGGNKIFIAVRVFLAEGHERLVSFRGTFFQPHTLCFDPSGPSKSRRGATKTNVVMTSWNDCQMPSFWNSPNCGEVRSSVAGCSFSLCFWMMMKRQRTVPLRQGHLSQREKLSANEEGEIRIALRRSNQ